jgi:CRISPR/Cas system-associated protein Cas10 (large subunit of type III CRISPR-Cas system)
MTLDEAIKYHEEIAEEHSKYANNSLTLESDRLHFKNSVNEHRQLVEWLKELKQLREERPQIRNCFNCKHDYKDATDEPCEHCEKHCNWQAKVKEAKND